eukprot:670277-Pyramimonas_sp.AAC.1
MLASGEDAKPRAAGSQHRRGGAVFLSASAIGVEYLSWATLQPALVIGANDDMHRLVGYPLASCPPNATVDV